MGCTLHLDYDFFSLFKETAKFYTIDVKKSTQLRNLLFQPTLAQKEIKHRKLCRVLKFDCYFVTLPSFRAHWIWHLAT